MDVSFRKCLEEYRGRAREFGFELEQYLDYHFDRFAQLAGFVSDCLEMTGDEGRNIRLLDVGPSFQTMLPAKHWPKMTIDTLGLKDTKSSPPSGCIASWHKCCPQACKRNLRSFIANRLAMFL